MHKEKQSKNDQICNFVFLFKVDIFITWKSVENLDEVGVTDLAFADLR